MLKLTGAGKRLEWIKRQKGLTDAVIGGWFGLSHQAINRWVQRDSIPLKYGEALSTHLGVSEEWLMKGMGQMPDFYAEGAEESDDLGISLRFYQEMTRLELTPAHLSKQLGYATSAIESYLLGKTPMDLNLLRRLARLGFSADFILGAQPLTESHNEKGGNQQINVNGQNHIGIIEQNKEKKASS